MDKKPFFSVIIPTLNEEKYLPIILCSLANQTYREFELIVVDGQSQDGTKAVFDKYKSGMPSATFYTSEKRNVSHQRNLGGEKAKGEYLVFLDADVNIVQTFLEEIHIQAIKKKFKLVTTWVVPDSKRPIDQVLMLLANLGTEIAKGINKPFIGGFDTIVRKDVFLRLKGFREEIRIGEDHDFAIRAKEKNIELQILKEPLVTFSLRRFRARGTLNIVRKLAQVEIHHLTRGPITSELFDYPMGGHVHKAKSKRKINLAKLNTYLLAIKKMERKLTHLLLE